MQPEGAFPVPDAERVRLDTVDRADVGQEQLVCCRARLVANDPRAGVVGFEIDRRCAAVAADVDDRRRVDRDARLGQRIVHALEHGQDHFLLGLRVGKRVFAVGELYLNCAECHWPSGDGCPGFNEKLYRGVETIQSAQWAGHFFLGVQTAKGYLFLKEWKIKLNHPRPESATLLAKRRNR